MPKLVVPLFQPLAFPWNLADLIPSYKTEDGYNPLDVTDTNLYTPLAEIVFPEHVFSKEEKDNLKTWAPVQSMIDLQTPQLIHIKSAPLLDPIHYLVGKYNVSQRKHLWRAGTMKESWEGLSKVGEAMNSSYVDAFFCCLSSYLLSHGFIHGINYYGSFAAIQKKFRFNVAEDLEYFHGCKFFRENAGLLFTLPSDWGEMGEENGKKSKLVLSEDMMSVVSIEEVDLEEDDKDIMGTEDDTEIDENLLENLCIEDLVPSNKIRSLSIGNSSESDDSELNYTTEGEETEIVEDEGMEVESSIASSQASSSEQDEQPIFIHIHDFPTQLIFLEKCIGTLDELFRDDHMNEKMAASAMFQIIMTLLAYQRAFNFTHNDLHTNNIMYQNTNTEFLYYRYNNKQYKVPTFGRVFKIIDFGRAIYTFRGQLYCSDSFFSNGDASGQYNFGPCLHSTQKAVVEPNMSFDLCRLGCSLFDYVIDDEMDESEMSEFQKTVNRWCLDDNGKNVLYKKNGEERYEDFKLYKMIARTVHQHTPENQMKYKFFNQFEYTSKKKIAVKNIINIDEICVC